MDGMGMGTRTWRPGQGWGGDSPRDAVTLWSPSPGRTRHRGLQRRAGTQGRDGEWGGHPEPPARVQP